MEPSVECKLDGSGGANQWLSTAYKTLERNGSFEKTRQ